VPEPEPEPEPGAKVFNLLQVHHYGQPYAAESTLEQAVRTAKQFGFTGLLCKALDGVTWMGNITAQRHIPDAIRSVDQVRQQADYCHTEGIEFYVWTNPLSTNSISIQGRTSGELANACDGLFLDAEPYDQFWGRNRPVGLAAEFCQRIREVAPNAFICLQPDPRPTQFPGIRPEEWLPYVDAVAGQHYWPTFQKSAQSELEAALQFSETCGLPNYPTLDYQLSPEELDNPILSQFPGFVLFVMGRAGPEVLRAVGELA